VNLPLVSVSVPARYCEKWSALVGDGEMGGNPPIGAQLAGCPPEEPGQKLKEGGKMRYITTTFSPSMIKEGGDVKAEIKELGETEFISVVRGLLRYDDCVPAVGHENTAALLARKIGVDRALYARVNITLGKGDALFCAIPQFRAPEGAREFSDEEVAGARFRYFVVVVEGC